MTLHLPRLAPTLDPLIAEAKRRARQRRSLAALGLVLVLGAAVATFALRSRGPAGTPGGGLAAGSSADFGSPPIVAGTIPYALFTTVPGRLIGWAKTGHDWFAVYVDKLSHSPCGLDHSSWRVSLVDPNAPIPLTASRRIGPAGCGNALAWVRAGRFSDGLHRDVAFFLWTTPAIGATGYVYRVGTDHLRLLATFHGDSLRLSRGGAIVGFENRGRSSHGELEDVYRFVGGRYRLIQRR
jgi:hypothetical protein